MEITQSQFERIKHLFPTQGGNVVISNLVAVNGLLYVAENGCKWRALPKRFGKWSTLYRRMNRWSKNGVLDRILNGLAQEGIINIEVDVVSVDSTTPGVHPDGTGALKKTVRRLSAAHAGG